MTFPEFSFQDGAIKRVCFEIDVNFDFFKSKTQVESERFDFENLVIGLNKVYQREWKSIGFSPIEKQFSMQFDLQENGQIKVHVRLSNPMITGKFEFEYVTDQTFIPELIKEIEIAMKENV